MNVEESKADAAGSRATLYAALGLLSVILVLFGDVFFTAANIVISHPNCDGRDYFSVMRAFAANELLHGRLPLWNPNIFCGVPFLAGFQSTLLYPLNAPYLVLPLAKAMNLEFALHVYLLGLFMFLWARYRGLHGLAAFLCAVAMMCSGPFWLRAMPGHMTMIDALAWAPLAFLAADKVLDGARWHWAFVGAVALALPIYAGHPQVFFSTYVALGAYAGLRWILFRRNIHGIALFALMFCAPPILGAAQLWPGLAVAGETVRALGLPFKAATTFSFPPENFITLFAPTFFGDYVHSAYVGHWVLWEASAYIGVGTLLLATLAVVRARSREKYLWLGLIGFFVLLALGRYTPIYWIFYHAPGFSGFRGPGRFLFYAALFAVLLAGYGAQLVFTQQTRVRWLVWSAAVIALGLLAVSVSVSVAGGEEGGLWARAIQLHVNQGEAWLELTPDILRASVGTARIAGYGAAFCVLLFACLLGMSARKRWAAYALLGIGIAEVVICARVCRATYDMDAVRQPALDEFLRNDVGEARVWDIAGTNYPMNDGAANIWGYDPVTLMRYTEFMARSQGARVEDTLHEIPFKHYSPAFRMLRCAYVVDSRDEKFGVRKMPGALPRFILFDRYEVNSDKEQILSTLLDPAFDASARLMLESPPAIEPEPGGAAGAVRVISEDSDSIEFEIDIEKPAVLLVTDAYCSGWRVAPLEGSVQREYVIQPADYVLRAVPLRAGHHHFRMEYAPAAFTYGVRTTLAGGTGFLIAWMLVWLRERAVQRGATATA